MLPFAIAAAAASAAHMLVEATDMEVDDAPSDEEKRAPLALQGGGDLRAEDAFCWTAWCSRAPRTRPAKAPLALTRAAAARARAQDLINAELRLKKLTELSSKEIINAPPPLKDEKHTNTSGKEEGQGGALEKHRWRYNPESESKVVTCDPEHSS